ncbi:MAG: hypothetical protein K6L60_01285 [Oceanobacter sp.]|jgi:hypothetical protein
MDAAALEQSRETVINLYQTQFLRQHIGLTQRPDICLTLEFLVWLKTNHPTVLTFSPSQSDVFHTVRVWLGLQLDD